MRTEKGDLELRNDVAEALEWEPRVRDIDIAVAAKDGVVTLGGFVESYAQKYAAGRTVEHVLGVRAIANDLRVRLPRALERSDTDIALAAVSALRWNTEVPAEAIKVKVDDGWITLEGAVSHQCQKIAAEHAVQFLAGVKGVVNLIDLVPHVSIPDVSLKIKEALCRHAQLDAERIAVEASDGTVTLRGIVHSLSELRDAEHAAWSAPGVTNVIDELTVAF